MVNGKTEAALNIASEIKNPEIKMRSYVTICEVLLNQGYRKQAESIAKKHELEENYSEIFSTYLIDQGEIDEALNEAIRISNKFRRDKLFEKIAIKLMENKEEERAHRVASLIDNDTFDWKGNFYLEEAIKIIKHKVKAR